MLNDKITFERESAEFADKTDVLVDKVIISEGGRHLVWLKTGLSNGIAPAQPQFRIPIRLPKTYFGFEALAAVLTPVCSGDTLNGCEYFLSIHF